MPDGDLTLRERLLVAFGVRATRWPFVAAAIEIRDHGQPPRADGRDYKKASAARLTETGCKARAPNP
jgi:hypothetical protein